MYTTHDRHDDPGTRHFALGADEALWTVSIVEQPGDEGRCVAETCVPTPITPLLTFVIEASSIRAKPTAMHAITCKESGHCN